MKNLIMFCLAVIIWYPTWDKFNKPHTTIVVYHNASRVEVISEPIGSELLVTPITHVWGFPVGREVRGIQYRGCMWTVINNDDQTALMVNQIKARYEKIAPVDEIRLEPESSNRDSK